MSRSIFYLSTYPPRRCGIATFTRDLRAAVGGGRVYALGPTDGGPPEIGHTDPPEVMAFLLGHDAAHYRHAAIAIDGLDTGVVSLQHEYGIYGGPDGANVLAFTDRLRTPLVTTLHTVLPEPGERQRAIVRELGRRSEAMVVMSETAAGLLDRRYDVDPARVRVIPHGVPDLVRVDPELVKPELGLAGHRVVLSFGLIGPGKGYEAVIEAMADVAERVPDALYVILGTTHPELVRREGERYRDSLRERAQALGIADRIRFEDRFVGRSELARWLQAADVFVTPYPNLDQIVSGTLSYAMGAGLAIVSTPYLYARELLAGGRGLLVPPASPMALAESLSGLLLDPDRRQAIAARAYARGREMTWPTVGAAYRDLFDEVAGESVEPRSRRLERAAEAAHVA
jgi:glycosyltransferase involved in cell wall biosynthesis